MNKLSGVCHMYRIHEQGRISRQPSDEDWVERKETSSGICACSDKLINPYDQCWSKQCVIDSSFCQQEAHAQCCGAFQSLVEVSELMQSCPLERLPGQAFFTHLNSLQGASARPHPHPEDVRQLYYIASNTTSSISNKLASQERHAALRNQCLDLWQL